MKQLSTVNKVLYKTLLAFDYKHLISLKKDIWKMFSPVLLDETAGYTTK